MPDILTEITEIVTGLGMTGIDDVQTALEVEPAVVRNVEAGHWERLRDAFDSGLHTADFTAAWSNGRAFLESPDGLRGRTPMVVEWKGPQHQPGYDTMPADLRVDHVYLVSCKYRSQILANSSPANLFIRRLADRTAAADGTSWYWSVAPDEFGHFYTCVRRAIGLTLLPAGHQDLRPVHIARIRERCGRSWPPALVPVWRELSLAVAKASADTWKEQLHNVSRREEMLWRLLRLGPAPYFVLGSSATGPMRLRIGTPWDWRQNFKLQALTIDEVPAGQPTVRWHAALVDQVGGGRREVAGHVEVRWAHGRYSTVEAKIYLDTPHADVPGYFPIR